MAAQGAENKRQLRAQPQHDNHNAAKAQRSL